MGETTARQSELTADGKRIARIEPTQRRSRERFERILSCAIEVMAEKGSDAFRMSDIVERTGIPFGSLYQYFPDRPAISQRSPSVTMPWHTIASERKSALTAMRNLHGVLGGIADSYYQYFFDEPAVFHIWQATQATARFKESMRRMALILPPCSSLRCRQLHLRCRRDHCPTSHRR